MKHLIIVIAILLYSSTIFSQRKDVEWLRKGNEQFLDEAYDDAEISYQKSLEENGNYAYAMFNLGNTFFAKQDYEKARDQFENAAQTTDNKLEKSRAYYNLGASYTMTAVSIAQELKENPAMAQDGLDPYTFLEQGAEAFKDALRNNPSDEDARYNLAYLQKLMEKTPPPQQDQNNENQDQDNQDQNQEEKDNQNQDQQDKGDQSDQQDQQDNGDQDKQEPKDESDQNKPKPEELTKQQAQQILDAIDRNEKEIRDKMNLKKGKGEKVKIEKDW